MGKFIKKPGKYTYKKSRKVKENHMFVQYILKKIKYF